MVVSRRVKGGKSKMKKPSTSTSNTGHPRYNQYRRFYMYAVLGRVVSVHREGETVT